MRAAAFRLTPLAGAPAAAKAPPAAEQLAAVRLHDLADFWITFVLTVVGFVLVTYPDKSFGVWCQYIAAFIAGATGQVAIAWELLPRYRSSTVAGKSS